MQRELLLSLYVFSGLAGLGSVGFAAFQNFDRVFVVNLKDPHPIEGTVTVGAPIPHSETQSLLEVDRGPRDPRRAAPLDRSGDP